MRAANGCGGAAAANSDGPLAPARATSLGHAQAPVSSRAAKYTAVPTMNASGRRQPPRARNSGTRFDMPDVERHAGRQCEPVLASAPMYPVSDDAGYRGHAERRRGEQRATASLPCGQEQAGDGEPLGHLVEDHGDEHQRTDRATDFQTARYRDPVHEGVQQQAHQRRHAHRLGDVMRLLAEVEMGPDHVLRDVHREVATQRDDGSRVTSALQRLGEQVDHRDADHEARGERQHRVQRAGAPSRPPGDRERTEHVRASGRERVDELAVFQSRRGRDRRVELPVTRAAARVALPPWTRRSPDPERRESPAA